MATKIDVQRRVLNAHSCHGEGWTTRDWRSIQTPQSVLELCHELIQGSNLVVLLIGVLLLVKSTRVVCQVLVTGGDTMNTILLVVLVLLLIGALPTWPHSANWGYYPSGGLGLVLLILVILLLTGRLPAS